MPLPSRLQVIEKLPRALYELAFAVISLAVAAPLVASRHVPLQDLPQHMAALSVLRRLLFSSSLDGVFTLTLSRTQYLFVYALGVPLSYVFGVEGAGKLLAAITVVALPYALRFTLRRTGGDERMAALAWPLAWNPQMMLGFLNFLLGIPLALVALGLFADPATRGSRRRQVALALLALATFYSHLIPFGVLGLGVLLLLDVESLRRDNLRTEAPRMLKELAFLAPSAVAFLAWILRTPATDASVRAGGVGVTPHPEWPAFASLPRELSSTLLDFPGEYDERSLIVWGLGLLAALALGQKRATEETETTPTTSPPWWLVGAPLAAVAVYLVRHRTFAWIWGAGAPPETSWGEIFGHAAVVWAVSVLFAWGFLRDASLPTRAVTATRGARLAWLPAILGLLYVSTPASYGWIWPIHTRFAVTAALVVPLLAGAARLGRGAWWIAALVGAFAVGMAGDVGARFVRWEATEYGDLDEALARAQPGRRLVALVPAMASGEVPNVPVLHSAAYYQMRGGAVATFSFADFPQSPFRYREGPARPPRLPPRWEWTADLRVADPSLDYYDYILVRRGAADEPERSPDLYERLYEGHDWTLYQRRGRRASP